MNKIIILLFFSILSLSSASAQKIKKHEIDKFTKTEFIQTSSAKLINVFGTMRPHQFECYIESHDGIITMPAKMQFDMESISIDENSGAILLLDNGDTVRLYTLFLGTPDRYNAFSTCFKLSQDDVEKLLNHKILSIRMIYVGGHYDADVKEKNQETVSKMLKLVNLERTDSQ